MREINCNYDTIASLHLTALALGYMLVTDKVK